MKDDNVKLKGVEWSFQKFLWKVLTEVYDLLALHNYFQALERLYLLHFYLPNHMKAKFKPRFENVYRELTGESVGGDLFLKLCKLHKVRQLKSRIVVLKLLDELVSELDRYGYLEKVASTVPTGFSHTWLSKVKKGGHRT